MSLFLPAFEEQISDPYRATRIPTKLTLKGSMLHAFLKHLPYFKIIDQWEGHKPSYTFTADRMFEGDEGTWEMFLRLFFPFSVPKIPDQPVFRAKEEGGFEINQDLYTEEEINGLLDFFLVPTESRYDVLKGLYDIHKLHAFYTRSPSPHTLALAALPSRYNANLALTPSVNESNDELNTVENDFYNANNESNTENNNLYGKLSNANYRRFVGSTKSRKGKTKKLKKKTT